MPLIVPFNASSTGPQLSAFSSSTPVTFSHGERYAKNPVGNPRNLIPKRSLSSGKWFWEVRAIPSTATDDAFAGLFLDGTSLTTSFTNTNGFAQRLNNGAEIFTGANNLGVITNVGAVNSSPFETIQWYIDLDNREMWIGRDGNTGTGNPSTRASPHFRSWTGSSFRPFYALVYNNQIASVFPTPAHGTLPAGYQYLTE